MSVFFSGRLLVTPTTASNVDDSGLANKNLTVGNVVALVGRSAGGRPQYPLRFGSPDQAKAVLRSGELLTAVLKAFDPSAETGSPSEVVAFRVNPAVQSSLALKDASASDAAAIKSTDYGLYTAQIKMKIETGTTNGKKVTTQLGNGYYSQDNIGRNALSVQYVGASATANISVTNSTVTLNSPAGSPVAVIDLASFPTVEQLVDRINAVAGFSAATLDGNATKPTLNGLDTVTTADVKNINYTVKADLQAFVDWINGTGEGLLSATRPAGAGAPPANIAFTYLSGGSDGTTTNTSWSDTFTVLQTVDVQWVTPISGEPSIHAMTDAHVAFMSTVGKKERRAICGMLAGSTDVAAIAAAKVLNSDRTSLTHLGFYDYDEPAPWCCCRPT